MHSKFEYKYLLTFSAADHFFDPILLGADPILQLSVFMVVACSIILGVSRRGGSFMLSILKYIIQLCFMRDVSNPENLSPRDKKLLSRFPADPRSIEAQFHLEGKHTIYTVCPNEACHATYKPTFQDDSPIPNYPTRCTQSRFSKVCKEFLLRPRDIDGHVILRPIKPFVYFDFRDWVGSLLARPGFEDKMDSAWNTSASDDPAADCMHDIFDGEMLRNFNGPDGKHFSVSSEEGRYVFSLCVDFFNPLSNKQAGKKVSVGLISLVCLNLPPELRYKPENMFLAGVIPGPHEPPLNALNHYLTPLIDDFLDFWNHGVCFTCTEGYHQGCLVRCALVCIVCDLPAARKTAGFAASSHNRFCVICCCTRKEHGYGNIDCDMWRHRTNAECHAYAESFRAAESEEEREAVFNASGLRWSELLRLPYFDPTRFVVVDAMHNLFLGLIQEHFQGILGIRLAKDSDVDASPVLDIPLSDRTGNNLNDTERKSLSKALTWLMGPMNHELASELGMIKWTKKLSNLHLEALKFLCQELHCAPIAVDPRKKTMNRPDYARGILIWVSTHSFQC